MWETICDAQAGFWLNSKFLSKFSRKPLSGISDQKAPPPNEKLQIWDDQSLLRNTLPKKMKNFRFEMTKVYSGIPPPLRLGLESGRSYMETNLYPPWIPLVSMVMTEIFHVDLTKSKQFMCTKWCTEESSTKYFSSF